MLAFYSFCERSEQRERRELKDLNQSVLRVGLFYAFRDKRTCATTQFKKTLRFSRKVFFALEYII